MTGSLPAVSHSPDGGAQTVVPVIDVLLAAGHQQEFGFGEDQLEEAKFQIVIRSLVPP